MVILDLNICQPQIDIYIYIYSTCSKSACKVSMFHYLQPKERPIDQVILCLKHRLLFHYQWRYLLVNITRKPAYSPCLAVKIIPRHLALQDWHAPTEIRVRLKLFLGELKNGCLPLLRPRLQVTMPECLLNLICHLDTPDTSIDPEKPPFVNHFPREMIGFPHLC